MTLALRKAEISEHRHQGAPARTTSSRFATRASYYDKGKAPFFERTPKAALERAVWIRDKLTLLRWSDCRAALHDCRFHQGVFEDLRACPHIDPVFLNQHRDSLLEMEGPKHTHLHRLVLRTLRQRESQAPARQALMLALLGRVCERGEIEAVDAICTPYAVSALSLTLGLRDVNAALLLACAESIQGWMTCGLRAQGQAISGHAALHGLLQTILERIEPDDESVAGRLKAACARKELSQTEAVALLNNLVVAGVETSRLALANLLYVLSEKPQDWDALRAAPQNAARAVAETMRLAPVGPVVQRRVLADVELDGLHIRQGTGVILSLASANRDPQIFDHPDRYWIDRPRRPILSFGAGRHACVGAGLASALLIDALVVLCGTFQTPGIAGEVRWRRDGAFQGPTHLPLRLARA